MAALGRGTAAALRENLPAAASVGNPIDVLGDADPERYVEALDAAQDDDSVDAIIVLLTPQAMTRPADTARAIARRLRGDEADAGVLHGRAGRDARPRGTASSAGLPDYPSPERAVAALQAMFDYAAWRQRPPRVVTRFPVNRRRVERIMHRRVRTGQCAGRRGGGQGHPARLRLQRARGAHRRHRRRGRRRGRARSATRWP